MAFPRLVRVGLGRLGVAVEDAVLQPVPAHHLARMAEFIAATQPDVVILNLGGHETALTVGTLVRRALGLRGVRSLGGFVPDAGGSYAPRPDAPYRPSWRQRGRVVVRSALHRAWLSRYVRTAEIAARMDAAARAAAELCDAPVFLLDPVPCANPQVAKYRRKVSQALPASPPAYRRVTFGSVALPAESYVDDVHLGAAGQRFVADRLLEALVSELDLGAGDRAST